MKSKFEPGTKVRVSDSHPTHAGREGEVLGTAHGKEMVAYYEEGEQGPVRKWKQVPFVRPVIKFDGEGQSRAAFYEHELEVAPAVEEVSSKQSKKKS